MLSWKAIEFETCQGENHYGDGQNVDVNVGQQCTDTCEVSAVLVHAETLCIIRAMEWNTKMDWNNWNGVAYFVFHTT